MTKFYSKANKQDLSVAIDPREPTTTTFNIIFVTHLNNVFNEMRVRVVYSIKIKMILEMPQCY